MLLLIAAMLAAPEASQGSTTNSLAYGSSTTAPSSLSYGTPKPASVPSGYRQITGYGTHLAGYGATTTTGAAATSSTATPRYYLPRDAASANSLEVLTQKHPVSERLVSDKAGVVWAYMPSLGMYRNIKTGSLRYGTPDIAPKKDYSN